MTAFPSSRLAAVIMQAREQEESLITSAKARAELRTALWVSTMMDDDADLPSRLRASELSAKADGAFVDKTQVGIDQTFREMVMTAARSVPLVDASPVAPAIAVSEENGEDDDPREYEVTFEDEDI